MSKSSTGTNPTVEDMMGTTTEQAISNFYGSGDRITQPDIGYYDQFLLPGDTGRAPVPAQEGPATSPPPASSPMPGGSDLTNAGYPASMPPNVVEAITRLNTGGIGGRKNMLERRRAQEVINNFVADPSSAAPAAPVNLAGMNLSTSMPTPASQPPAMTPSPGAGFLARPAVMPARGPMVPIFDFEDMERGIPF